MRKALSETRMVNIKLEPDDVQFLKRERETYNSILEKIEHARQFKLGDYLIMVTAAVDYKTGEKYNHTKQNSYGVALHYQVVYIDTENNIPYAKELTKFNVPTGPLISCVNTKQSAGYRHDRDERRFEVDPEYAESILLDASGEYNPSGVHKAKSDLYQEITKHNKAARIDTCNLTVLCTVFDALNIGDVIYTSNTGSFLITDKQTVARSTLDKYSVLKRVPGRGLFTRITVQDKKGKHREYLPHHFHQKALYKEKPRTYKELKDLNL